MRQSGNWATATQGLENAWAGQKGPVHVTEQFTLWRRLSSWLVLFI